MKDELSKIKSTITLLSDKMKTFEGELMDLRTDNNRHESQINELEC